MKGEYEVHIHVIVSAQIASDYGNDPSITSILDTMDIFLLPVTNPDGYVFSQTQVSLDFSILQQKSGEMCRNFKKKIKVIFLPLITLNGMPNLSVVPSIEAYSGVYNHFLFQHTISLHIARSERISVVRLGC